jgi:hypothetical protein
MARAVLLENFWPWSGGGGRATCKAALPLAVLLAASSDYTYTA